MEKETLYRYVACQASPEEETAVLTWLEADPAHESELAKVQRQHDLVALSAPVINELYAKDRRRRFGSVLRRWSAAAAAVVLLAFGGYYFHAARDFSRQGERLLSVSVPYGQRVSLTLQDGTSVWLNAGTTLRYPAPFMGGGRREGRDAARPRRGIEAGKLKGMDVDATAEAVERIGTLFHDPNPCNTKSRSQTRRG